jgi:hypothetical protein
MHEEGQAAQTTGPPNFIDLGLHPYQQARNCVCEFQQEATIFHRLGMESRLAACSLATWPKNALLAELPTPDFVRLVGNSSTARSGLGSIPIRSFMRAARGHDFERISSGVTSWSVMVDSRGGGNFEGTLP